MTVTAIRKKCQRRVKVKDLTVKQANVLTFILRRWANGTPTTVRDIGSEFGITSPNGVVCHLRALQKKGYLRSPEHRAGCHLTDKALELVLKA